MVAGRWCDDQHLVEASAGPKDGGQPAVAAAVLAGATKRLG